MGRLGGGAGAPLAACRRDRLSRGGDHRLHVRGDSGYLGVFSSRPSDAMHGAAAAGFQVLDDEEEGRDAQAESTSCALVMEDE